MNVYGSLEKDRITKETEKAVQFNVTIETWGGKFINWSLWLPKSVLNKATPYFVFNNDTNEPDGWEVNSFMINVLWADKLPANAKEIR